jgi:hypothetical protein
VTPILLKGSSEGSIIRAMENRVQRVILETPRHRIIGDLTLPREGYRSRLSDFLNRGDLDFVPLTDAEIIAENGSPPQRRSFIAVARQHVQLAYPLTEGGSPEAEDPAG